VSCPCPDSECQDVHAHDVTASFAIDIDIRAMLSGLTVGGPTDGD
jgi:hypothetical protein